MISELEITNSVQVTIDCTIITFEEMLFLHDRRYLSALTNFLNLQLLAAMLS